MTVSATDQTGVLVVGGGPAGAAVALRLARLGHHVTVAERRSEPPTRSRGQSLTPRARLELLELGIDPAVIGGHVVLGTRMWHADRAVTVPWPDAGDFGVVVERGRLGETLLGAAADAGAVVLSGARATTPVVERGFVRGARLEHADGSEREVRCRFLVVADGANSRFGRVLGTTRAREWPYAVSTSSIVTAGRCDDPWLDTVLGLTDVKGDPITGHAWVNPMGGATGTVDVGLTVLSTYRDVLGVNAVKLFESFARSVAPRWRFDPDALLVTPRRHRVPLGGSVHPKMGPTYLVVGDAAGMANPLNSHGIGPGLLSARLAAEVLDEALTVGGSMSLQRYPARLAEEVGRYHQVGRLAARFLGRPALLRFALGSAMSSERAMGAALRIAANELRDDDPGGAERAYRLASLAARFAPSW